MQPPGDSDNLTGLGELLLTVQLHLTLLLDQLSLLSDALIAAAAAGAGATAMTGAGAAPRHHPHLATLQAQVSILTVPLTETIWSLG